MKKILFIISFVSVISACATTNMSKKGDMDQCRTASVNCGSC